MKKFWPAAIGVLLLLAVLLAGFLWFHRRETVPPRIGISGQAVPLYASAIEKAGGLPVLLPHDPSTIEDLVATLDGLVLPGGDDIPPSEYGEEAHPSVVLVTASRYEFESKLARAWMESGKPLLGICLGCQLINVARGGSLVQDIPSQLGGNHRQGHSVEVKEQSRLLRAIVSDTRFDVNSSHHQAVKALGQGLRVAATAPDGVVEAIETTEEDRFLLGVQWHPEKMSGDRRQERIFEALVESAKKRRESSASR